MATIKIALAGNPNCGKTTLFNALTGSSQYVGNWPGVTVEKKEGALKGGKGVVIQDLPGIYSLSPYSLEEVVARSYLVEERPDAILNIVDGTNIERNLYLTTQLLELGIPTVVAVNMMDVVKKSGDRIDLGKLSKELRCPVLPISALKGDGISDAAAKVVELANGGKAAERPHVFTGSVEHALAHIEESIQDKAPKESIRWYAIKIFERDGKAYAHLGLDNALLAHLGEHIEECEKEMDDDCESIITNQRYARIKELTDLCISKAPKKGNLSLSDKIDRVVTNRILALPIFLLSLCVMWWLAVAEKGPGTVLTDWANDEFLADGWHLPYTTHEVDGKDWETASEDFAKAEATIAAWEAGEKTASLEDEETGEIADEWDVDEEAYKAAQEVEEPDPADYGVWIPGIGALLEGGLDAIGVGGTVKSLVLDGAWGGVATVLGFVPVIFVVFVFLAFLEDCGYMARVAFIMDRLFRKFGLSGKSFIPIIVGKGCGVPAVMATRTIESERDRRMTIILATFIPCGAKTVIIAMFSALFFREQWYIAALMDVLGIAIIVLGGIALKKSSVFAGDAAPFVMELPAYHMPTLSGIWRHTWTRLKGYMLKAGLIIFPACVFLWFIMNFDFGFHLVGEEGIDRSMLAVVGNWFAWLLAPLGFGTWQGAAASVSAEIAKEQATATLGLVAANMDGVSTAAKVVQLFGSFVPAWVAEASRASVAKLIALSFMCFNLFIPPCMVAIAVTFREMGSKAWGWFAIAFQLFVGYALTMSIYQIGLLAVTGHFGVLTAAAIAVDLLCLWAVVRRGRPEVA